MAFFWHGAGELAVMDAPDRQLRVMVIDLSAGRAALLEQALRDQGCDVVARLSGNEDLLAQVDRHSPEVLLIDLDMADRDTLESLRILSREPMHGYGIAQRLKLLSSDVLQVGESSLYPALQRLLLNGYVQGEGGPSENNRRARFYAISRAGRKQLAREADLWERTVAMMSRLLGEHS